MKGLIKKDFLLLKRNLKYFLIVVIIFTIFSLDGKTFNVAFIVPFIMMTVFISTFSWDDFNNFNAYAIALPIGRKNIVKSKYISAVILIIISILLGITISLSTHVILKNAFDFQTVLSDIAGTILGLVIVLSIWLPSIYKFGVEKGRIMLFVGVFLIAFLVTIASKIFDFSEFINFLNSLENIWFIIVPILTISFLTISYLISKKIYLKKEF